MKNISKILIIMFFASVTLVSCDDMLNVESDRFILAEDHDMTGANDTLYSMFGILSQLQKLADSYVLLGELRADLMTVTDSADLYLKEINSHEISANNPFSSNIKDYYAVINNCNFVIHNIDTSVVKGGQKTMYKTYAAVKAIRAWTYMQIALNFGKVKYYDNPLLTVADAQKDYVEYNMEQLAPVLIADLEPIKDADYPSMGLLYTHLVKESFFPVRFILGDLYLWLGAYYPDNAEYNLKAANEYRDLMFKNNYYVNKSWKGSLGVTNNVFDGGLSLYYYWYNTGETVTNIAATNQYGEFFKLDSLVENMHITSSQLALDNWNSEKYVHSATLDTLGDLRKYTSVSKRYSNSTLSNRNYLVKYSFANSSENKNASKIVYVYRAGLLYLRYAEAVNRLGKPNLALAVLKNGLNKATFLNRKLIPAIEMEDPLPNYMNFGDTKFDANMGVHSRGCGNTQLDTVYLRIPDYSASATPKNDSIVYVENLIQKELALETAFEGNRFHDLMRLSIRRNDNEYMAEIISSKYANKSTIKNKLLNRANWYLK
jgi:starch-binding outer membrane protein, SusD/RagB family